MKKALIFLYFILPALFLVNITNFSAATAQKMYFHYYRFDSDYNNMQIHAWFENGDYDTPIGFFEFKAENRTDYIVNGSDFSFGGAVAEVPVSDYFGNIGFVIKEGPDDNWSNKDTDTDRYADTKWVEKDSNGNYHVYVVTNQVSFGISRQDKDNHMPDKRNVRNVSFISEGNALTGIELEMNNLISGSSYVIRDTVGAEIETGKITNKTQVINTSHDYDIEKIYTVTIGSDTRQILLNKMYDSEFFANTFEFDGELGVIHQGNKTIFRLWSPNVIGVKLNLFKTSDYRSDTSPYETKNMKYAGSGVHEIELDKATYLNKYYTFSIYRLGEVLEIVDPYAYTTGLNGVRGQIIDFDIINEKLDFLKNDRPDMVTNWTDYIVYELHVRDLSTHSSWNGNEEYRGKFLGLTEEGTTYTEGTKTVTTGIDHIKELGVNTIQLLPIFDNAIIDETRLDDEGYNAFNWGYMPLNYNALEGTYATDQINATVKVEEFKKTMQYLTENDLRVVMDVVYNHTGHSYDSNLYKILPGYYHRMRDDGSFYNGSGCLNETASERAMMRKFMIDSTVFWATEYNLSGFRFDLMGLHDIETMDLIVDELTKIDPTIIVYGEPWDGGDSGLDEREYGSEDHQAGLDKSRIAANYNNRYNMKAGAFNDITRNALKGDGDGTGKAFVSGEQNGEINNKIRYGITGGAVVYDNNDYHIASFPMNPEKLINYVSAHDNFTLYDRLKRANPDWTDDEIGRASVLANGTILLSEGVAFIHAGAEMMRTKVVPGYNDYNSESARDSYDQPDFVNQLDYSFKIKYFNIFEQYSELVHIRSGNDGFRLKNRELIVDRLAHYYELGNSWIGDNVLSYKVMNSSGASLWVIIASGSDAKINLGNSNYRIISEKSSLQEGEKTGEFTSYGNHITVLSEPTYKCTFNIMDGKVIEREYRENGYLSVDFEYYNNELIFDGWYLDESFTKKLQSDYVTGDLTLYAKYVKTTFINITDGSEKSFYITENTSLSEILEKLGIPKRGNQKFLGWADDEGIVIDENYRLSGSALSIHAKWGIELSVITGTIENIVNIEVGSSIANAYQPEEKDGYWFTGYYTDENYSEEFDKNTPLYNPASIYLKYEKKNIFPVWAFVLASVVLVGGGLLTAHLISKKKLKKGDE